MNDVDEQMIESFVSDIGSKWNHGEKIKFLKEWARDLESLPWVGDQSEFCRKIRRKIQQLNQKAGL
jgi:hypothetical protein